MTLSSPKPNKTSNLTEFKNSVGSLSNKTDTSQIYTQGWTNGSSKVIGMKKKTKVKHIKGIFKDIEDRKYTKHLISSRRRKRMDQSPFCKRNYWEKKTWIYTLRSPMSPSRISKWSTPHLPWRNCSLIFPHSFSVVPWPFIIFFK